MAFNVVVVTNLQPNITNFVKTYYYESNDP